MRGFYRDDLFPEPHWTCLTGREPFPALSAWGESRSAGGTKRRCRRGRAGMREPAGPGAG